MDVAVMSRFFALLALLALFGGGALWVGLARRAAWLDHVRPVAGIGALAVAATAMAGSLYYSEVAGFTPCKLCWYQRIGIYPMVVLTGVALVRRVPVRDHVLALGLLTAPISIYHYALQTWPSLEGGTCDASAPCAVRWVEEFGFVSIPFMALSAVVAVTALVVTSATAAGQER